MGHNNIWDADPVLKINKGSRTVTVPAACRVVGVVGDHGSEVVTFECPRFIEGHDIAGCAARWIGWTNARGESGRFDVGSVETSGDVVRFTWTIYAGVTAQAGAVAFAVHFMDLGSSGEVLYKWSTATCRDLRVQATTESSGDNADGLVYAQIDEGEVNAAVYTAVRKVLYG